MLTKLKPNVFLLLLFLFSNTGFSQKSSPPPPPAPQRVNNDCFRNTNWSVDKRLKNYPFNKTSQIQFVSFENNTDSTRPLTLRKNGLEIQTEIVDYAIFQDSLPRINDTICYSKLLEVKSLTFSQVNKLTDIIYNYGFSKNSVYATKAGCFEPRNAILFLDNNGKVFEFIEVCFHCGNIKSSNNNIAFGDMCIQKMDMLRSLYKEIGIKHGVITQ